MARKRTKSTPIKRRPDWKARFLDALRNQLVINVAEAAKIAGIARRRVYTSRDIDPEFADAWDEILEAAIDRREAELDRRAMEGNRITRRRIKRDGSGQVIEDVEETTDGPDTTALIFSLKADRPEKYDRATIDQVRKMIADALAAPPPGVPAPEHPTPDRDGAG